MELDKIWEYLEYVAEIGIYSQIFSHFTFIEIEDIYQNNKERLDKIYNNEQFWNVMFRVRYSDVKYDTHKFNIMILYKQMTTAEYILRNHISSSVTQSYSNNFIGEEICTNSNIKSYTYLYISKFPFVMIWKIYEEGKILMSDISNILSDYSINMKNRNENKKFVINFKI